MSPALLVPAACLSWIVVSIYVFMFVQWMIGGDVDVITGVLGIGVFVGMGAYAFTPSPYPELRVACMIGIVASSVMLPVLRWSFTRRSARDDELDGVRKAYEGFVFRPNNYPAMIRLARHLWNLGVRGHAIALAEVAVPNLPRQYFPDEHRLLAQWRAHPPAPSEFQPIPCVECGEQNPPGIIHCNGCGARYLLHRVEGRIVSKALGKKLLASWIVTMLTIGVIPVAAKLSGTKALTLVVVLIIVAVGTMVLAFRPPRTPA